jgi:hypothetical protein
MQTKKRAKAVKFGKKIDKPASTEKEAVKAEPVIEQKEEKETSPKKIESKPIESQPEEQEIPQEEPEIKEEETKITEIQQTEIKETDFKEVIIHAPSQGQPNETPQDPPRETREDTPQGSPKEPPQEPPIEPPLNSPERTPEEQPVEEKQEETIKVEESEETYDVETKEKKNFLGYFMLIAIISFIIGLLSMAGINYFNQKTQDQDNSKKTAVTTKLSPTNTPSPTPEPLDLSKYNIKILNGSGVTGAASELKESLAGEGFTVITTGNAATSNYTGTTVLAGKDIDPKYLEKLKSFLSQSYTLASDSAAPDGATAGADVTIIIGKN